MSPSKLFNIAFARLYNLLQAVSVVLAQSSILCDLSSNREITCCCHYTFDKLYVISVIPGAINS